MGFKLVNIRESIFLLKYIKYGGRGDRGENMYYGIKSRGDKKVEWGLEVKQFYPQLFRGQFHQHYWCQSKVTHLCKV